MSAKKITTKSFNDLGAGELKTRTEIKFSDAGGALVRAAAAR